MVFQNTYVILSSLVLFVYGSVDATSEVDGQWGPWQAWTCDRTCGGGRERRVRLCDSPAPQQGGAACSGPAQEMREVCHIHPCPDMSPEEAQLITQVQYELENSTLHDRNQLVLPVGEEAILDCEHTAIDLLDAFYTDLTIHWSHNLYDIAHDNVRISQQGTKLVNSAVRPNDTGVYVCEARFNKNESRIIRVVSLAVTSLVATVHLHLGRPLSLYSNDAPLALILDNLEVMWYHEDLAYYEFTGTAAARARDAEVDALTRQDLGVWYCQVVHPATKRMWMTNWLRVGLQAPRLQTGSAVKDMLGVLCIVLGVFVVLLLSVGISMIIYKRLNPVHKAAVKIRVADLAARVTGLTIPYEEIVNRDDTQRLANNADSDDALEGGVTPLDGLVDGGSGNGNNSVTVNVNESALLIENPGDINYDAMKTASGTHTETSFVETPERTVQQL